MLTDTPEATAADRRKAMMLRVDPRLHRAMRQAALDLDTTVNDLATAALRRALTDLDRNGAGAAIRAEMAAA